MITNGKGDHLVLNSERENSITQAEVFDDEKAKESRKESRMGMAVER